MDAVGGGWHDAGDHIKFTLTHAWAAYVLLKSMDAFPDAHEDRDGPTYGGVPNGIPDLLDEVRFGTDFLLQAVRDSNQTGGEPAVVARVGGDQDHDHFWTAPYQTRQPVEQGGGERPVYGGAKADIAGTVAAALALMGVLYQPYDAAYARQCVDAARTAYTVAERNPGTTPNSFYGRTVYLDALACGAIELFRATGEQAFFATAERYDAQVGNHYWVPDWDNHIDMCRHSLVKANSTSALARWRADVDTYPSAVSNAPYVRGLAYFLAWGSLRYALNAAFSAVLFHSVAPGGRADLLAFAASQTAYVMGSNEYNRSFVIGYGVNPPTRPHHATSYGHEDWPEAGLPHLYPLIGAMVGGPHEAVRDDDGTIIVPPGYEDDANDYVSNEVTLDYNAGLVGALAGVIVYGAR